MSGQPADLDQGPPGRLADLVATSLQVAAEPARNRKRDLIAAALRRADGDVGLAVDYLTASPRQRRTGVSWRTLRDVPEAAVSSTLTLRDVDGAFDELAGASGAGSAEARRTRVQELLSRATEDEQRFLRSLLTGELRQGALDGVLLDAVAVAADVPVEAVRRAAMLSGSLSRTAQLAMAGGIDALRNVRLTVGVPVHPMLAGSAPSVVDGVREAQAGDPAAEVVVDTKIDGVRVQIHRTEEDVAIYSRTLDDLTARLPAVADEVRRLDVRTAILDGEVVAIDEAGRQLAFQETGSRVARHGDAAAPLSLVLFDLLHVDGQDLIDLPARERFAELERVAPHLVVGRVATADPVVAEAAFRAVVAAGYEGVVIKRPDALYAAGRRGGGWIKVKPVHTLDLVVLGVEWGSGRRRGKLSNIHLGARDPATGGFVMVGKTFKGMTDAMLAWQTERFLELERGRDEHVVWLRPEQVVEIAYDGVQRSRRYPGGVALRFARVLRYRDDKTPAEADLIETLQARV